MTLKPKIKNSLPTILLSLALFVNPAGFDIIQYWLVCQTGSLWRANFVLYCAAVALFGLSIYFHKRFKLKTITEDEKV